MIAVQFTSASEITKKLTVNDFNGVISSKVS